MDNSERVAELEKQVENLSSQLKMEQFRSTRLRRNLKNISDFSAQLVRQQSDKDCTRGHVEFSVRLLEKPVNEGKKASLDAIVTIAMANAGVPGLRIDVPVFKSVENGSAFTPKSLGARAVEPTCTQCGTAVPVIPPVMDLARELQEHLISLYMCAKYTRDMEMTAASLEAMKQVMPDQVAPTNSSTVYKKPAPVRLI